MQSHRLIHDINKLVLNMYFQFKFFIPKLNKFLCTSLIIRVKSFLMIEMHKNMIRYKIECRLCYVNNNVNNAPT